MVREGVAEGQAFLLSTCAIPRNSALFKAFKEADAVVDFGADGKPWERERALRENFGTVLERFGLKMGTQVRDEFLARVGSDTRTILQELEKLLLYRGGPGEIKTADVEAITSVGKEAEAWDLTDAVGLRNSVKVALSLRRLEEQGTAPIMLSVMLDGRIRDLILIRAGLDGGWLRAYDKSASWDNPPREAQLAFGLAESLSKQTSYRLAKLAQQARNYTLNELRAARHHLMMMREQMVSGSLDEGFLMETTLFKIVGRPAPRGSSRG
jgi:DNA polymerase III delta subunit